MVNYGKGDFGRNMGGMGCPCNGVHSNGDFGASWGNTEQAQLGEEVQNLPYSYSSSYNAPRTLVNWAIVAAVLFLGYKYMKSKRAA